MHFKLKSGEMAEESHLLALRVMRLTKPSILGAAFGMLGVGDEKTCSKDCPAVMDQLLVLPQSFGNIFLGETFVSYVTVHNDSNEDATEIVVKADLQTGSQRINLIQIPARESMEPGSSIDDVMRHEVKELGTHILVCSVNYRNTEGRQRFFRKFFKFQVLKPLDVKTKFYNINPVELYLEAQIQNMTDTTMCIEKVSLDPSVTYNCVPVNEADGVSTFMGQEYLKPKDTRQYLYQLSVKTSDQKNWGQNISPAIGKLDIVWKTGLGERGRLQTSQLQRPSVHESDIHVGVVKIPGEVVAMQSFDMICRITNCSERSKNLKVSFENHNNLLWEGLSGYQLDKLNAKSSIDVTFNLLPISTGLLGVVGLRITDVEIDRTHKFDYIHYVLVAEDS